MKRVHARRMRGGVEEASEHKIFVVERVDVERTRGRTNEMCVVERVHVKRMRGGVMKCVWRRGCM